MSKRLSFDLELNAQGFKQGLNEATNATAQYTNATRDLKKETEDYLKEFGSLRKQFGAAKREAEALAAQFVMLSDAEKNSDFGKEMSEELDFAIKKAAELKDAVSDVNTAINREANDVAGLNAMKDAFAIGKDIATAYVGVIGKLTGSEKELKAVISSLAIVQGSFNAVMKVTEALQKESNIMLTLQRAGIISVAQANQINTIATKASTIATKALGVAIKSIPFIGIAAGALAAGKALVTYMTNAQSLESQQVKEKKELTSLEQELQAISNTYKSTLANSLGEARSKFEQLQRSYNSLTSQKERIQWWKENSKECENLDKNLNSLEKADKAFKNNSVKVVEMMRIRALVTAEAARNAQLYALKMKEIDNATTNVVKFEEGQKMMGSDIDRYGLEEGKDYKKNANKIGEYYLTAAGAVKANANALEKNLQTHTSEIDKQLQQSNQILEKHIQDLHTLQGDLYSGDTGGATKEQLTHLQELEKEAEKYAKAIENIKDPTSEEGKKELQRLQELWANAKKTAIEYTAAIGKPIDLKSLDDVIRLLNMTEEEAKDFKVSIGLGTPEAELNEYLKGLEEKLKQANVAYKLAVKNNDKAAMDAARKDAEAAQAELNKYSLTFKVNPEVQSREKFADIMKTLNTPSQPKYDFSGLSDAMQEAADQSLEQINRLQTAIKGLKDLFKETKDETLINQILEQLRDLGVQLDVATIKVKILNDQSTSNNKLAKEVRDRAEAFGYYGQMLNGVSNGLQALGDSEQAQAAQFAINSAAMIADCIQRIGAMQAEAIASGTASGARLPFPANLAAIATIVATIGSIFASLPKFAEGGMVGGTSFYGDKLLARVNSGERILTAEQNDTFEKVANNIQGQAFNTQTIIVEGKIRGKDLMLVQKNYNTTASKAGQSITF